MGRNEPPITSCISQCRHCGPGQTLGCSVVYVCHCWLLRGMHVVGPELLFKVLTGRVTKKGHGPLPAISESLATRSSPGQRRKGEYMPSSGTRKEILPLERCMSVCPAH